MKSIHYLLHNRILYFGPLIDIFCFSWDFFNLTFSFLSLLIQTSGLSGKGAVSRGNGPLQALHVGREARRTQLCLTPPRIPRRSHRGTSAQVTGDARFLWCFWCGELGAGAEGGQLAFHRKKWSSLRCVFGRKKRYRDFENTNLVNVILIKKSKTSILLPISTHYIFFIKPKLNFC